MRHTTHGLLLASCLLSALSCGDPTGPTHGVWVAATRETVLIRNENDFLPLYSFVIDEDHAPLVDWAPCARPDCGQVLPNETRKVRAEEIGSGPGKFVLVYWWYYGPGPADEITLSPIGMKRVRLVNQFPQ